MHNINFNDSIDRWIKEVEAKSVQQLCTRPSASSWSLAQVCLHLLHETTYYIEQVKICCSNNANATEIMASAAITMFQNNSLPNISIEGPATNSIIPLPGSKEALIQNLVNLKTELNNLQSAITDSNFKGKTKHPGLEYFNAAEWLQFADMHMRHHLHQLSRINAFLNDIEENTPNK